VAEVAAVTAGRSHEPGADLFVARQPILDARQRVVGYELLFRSGATNAFPVGTDLDVASSRVIADSLMVFGLDQLIGDQLAFVNITRETLLAGHYQCLPPERVVLELLETVRPDPEVLDACRTAQQGGYRLALDDVCESTPLEAFLPLVDILKLDCRLLSPDARRCMVRRLRSEPVQLLAEKVEDREQFAATCAEGFGLFQGFFFCRPEMLSRRDVRTGKLVYLKLLAQLQLPDLDFAAVEAIIKHDVSLSLKLLRFLNSAAFGWRSRVTSLKQALVLLGERPFRRWVGLLSVVELATEHPGVLAQTCLVRARQCELLAPHVGLRGRELDLFSVGLFSLLETLAGRPLDELTRELHLSSELCAALHQDPGSRMGQVLGLVVAHERGDWAAVGARAIALGLSTEDFASCYLDTVRWAREAAAAMT
jgi:c-di-GMP-related signal transduction protein